MKKTITYKVSLDFANYSDSPLADFAGSTATALDSNPAFPNPPVKPADLKAQVATFNADIQAAMMGGMPLTAKKNTSRETLLESLRANAYYVQTLASRDLDMLLSSGYFANSTNHAQSPLDKPAIVAIENETAQQLLVRVSPIDNARAYHVQTSTNGNGGWQDAGIHPQARRIVLAGLTSGTVYNVRARAIGGSTGASDWSDPQAHIST